MRGASFREGPGSQLVLGSRVEPLGLKKRQAVKLPPVRSVQAHSTASLPLSASRAAKREPGISLALPPAPSGFAQLPNTCSWLRSLQLAIVSSSSSTNLVSAARRELESAGALR